MKVVLIEFGKTKDKGLLDMLKELIKRVNRFCHFEVINLKAARLPKSSSANDHKSIESDNLKKVILPGDHIILLDERGKTYSSRDFAGLLDQRIQSGKSRLVFIIGGAYGFDESVYSLASESIALSSMTFSHQLIRLIFMEQLYRAFTILNNHPYHND